MSNTPPDLAGILAGDPRGRSRHLLILRAGTTSDDVAALARLRFRAARWEQPPDDAHPAGTLRLSRHTTLHGPVAVGRAESMDLQLPTWGETAFVVHAPRERADEPGDVGGDRDGLKRVFAAGMPVRDEGRVVQWLVDAARHLGGAVRFGEPAAVVVPDPLALVDVTVFAGVWLEPAAALHVVRGVLPQARLATEAHDWAGPADVPGLAALDLDPLEEAERAELHAAADDHDLAVLTGPDEIDGYGIEASLEIDGGIAVEVLVEDAPPDAVAAEPWAAQGVVSYRVMWLWDEDDDAALERPPMTYRVARGRAAPVVTEVAGALAAASAPAHILTPAGFPAR